MRPRITMLSLVLLAFTFPASAGEKEEALAEKVAAAYGGDAIKNLKSFSLFNKYMGPSLGQSNAPDLEEITTITQQLTLDIGNERAMFDTLFKGRAGPFQNATVINGEEAYNINYGLKTYGEANNSDVYTFGGAMRTTDAVLAHELWQRRDEAEHMGETTYRNRPHEMIKFPFPLSPDLTLYVDSESGLISRMVRHNPQLGRLDYVFSDWSEADGIRYARSCNFFVAGEPNLVQLEKQARFNVVYDAADFALPEGFSAEPDRIDTAEMSARKISDTVYHVGQGGAFSLFVQTSDGLVAAGATNGFADRLEFYRSESGNHRPLEYFIATHHHSDHVPGTTDAVAAGAKIVTVDSNRVAIDEFAGEFDEASYQFMSGRMTLGSGRDRVELYEIDTIHAMRYLLVYVPREELLFMGDHLNSPYESGTPNGNANTVSMMEALGPLDLDVDRITTEHGARIFSWRDFENAVAAYEPFGCLGDRPICN